MTAPKDWNQTGCAKRRSNSSPVAKDAMGLDMSLTAQQGIRFDVVSRSWNASLTPHEKMRMVLSDLSKPFETVLNVSVGSWMEQSSARVRSASSPLR